MRFHVGCRLSYHVTTDTTFIFNVEVAKVTGQQILNEVLTIRPSILQNAYTDVGSSNRYFGLNVPPGEFDIEYTADVALDVYRAEPDDINETPIGLLPLNVLPFLLPSRFVPSDRLIAFARAEFGALPLGHRRVTAICNWIHDHVEYHPGSSDEQTIASETLLKRAGICRDFAHLGVAFCRGLGIPARFVSCYAYGLSPSDFHAVFEAYLDGRWWLFDATRQAHLDGLVRIGAGRDAAEIAFSTAFGSFQPRSMEIMMERADGAVEFGDRTVEAISAC